MGQVATCVESDNDNKNSVASNSSPIIVKTVPRDINPTIQDKHKVSPEYPPLLVLHDCQTQTTLSHNSQTMHNKKSFKQRLIQFSVFAAVVYVIILCSILYSTTLQSKLVYLNFVKYPSGNLSNPSRFGLYSSRNINIITSDNVTIHGFHMIPPGEAASLSAKVKTQDDFFDKELACAETIVLFFHGNGANRYFKRRIQIANQLASQLNAHVIAIDYRGFGDSESWPSEEGTRLDATASWHWLRDVVDRYKSSCGGTTPIQGYEEYEVAKENEEVCPRHQNIFIYGHSLGTAIGTQLAVDIASKFSFLDACNSTIDGSEACGSEPTRPIPIVPEVNSNSKGKVSPLSGLLLDSPFTSITDVVKVSPILLPLKYLLPDAWVDAIIEKHFHIKYPSILHSASLALSTLPIWIIHSRDDAVIPVDHSRRLHTQFTQHRHVNNSKSNCGRGEMVETVEACAIDDHKRAVVGEGSYIVYVENEGVNHDNEYLSREWMESAPSFVRHVSKWRTAGTGTGTERGTGTGTGTRTERERERERGRGR